MADARPLDLLTRTDPWRRAARERGRACKAGRTGDETRNPLVRKRQPVCCPHAEPSASTGLTDARVSFGDEIPRLLDKIVPGFDRFLHRLYAVFRTPSTLLLHLNIRIPVLAGVARVASLPDHWAEGLVRGPERRSERGGNSHLFSLIPNDNTDHQLALFSVQAATSHPCLRVA
jgi:hypothetical protein